MDSPSGRAGLHALDQRTFEESPSRLQALARRALDEALALQAQHQSGHRRLGTHAHQFADGGVGGQHAVPGVVVLQSRQVLEIVVHAAYDSERSFASQLFRACSCAFARNFGGAPPGVIK